MAPQMEHPGLLEDGIGFVAGAEVEDAALAQTPRAAAAEVLAASHARAGDTLRIDVLLLAPGRFPRHMANALML